MGPIIRGVILGVIGAVVLAPVVLVLALFGIPLFMGGAIVLGAVLAIPLIIVAVLSIPLIVVFGALTLVVGIALLVAVKIALFVVLPIVVVGLFIGWLARRNQTRVEV